MSAKQPGIKWAQRKDCLYLTVTQAESKDVEYDFDEECKKFTLKFVKNGEKYELVLNLCGKIKVGESRFKNNRYIEFKLIKEKEETWNKLYEGSKMRNVQVDWNKWIDEDEEGILHIFFLKSNTDEDKFDWGKGGEGQAMDFMKKKKYDKENVNSQEALEELKKKMAAMQSQGGAPSNEVLDDLEDLDDDDDDVPNLEDVD